VMLTHLSARATHLHILAWVLNNDAVGETYPLQIIAD
jgi:hypothetical protein